MSRRTLFLLTLLLTMIITFYVSDFRGFRAISAIAVNSTFDREILPQPRSETLPLTPAKQSQLTPRKALQNLRNRYRLQVDRRFLRALEEIYQLSGKSEKVAITTQFIQGEWHLFVEDREIARLPELPSFAEAMTMLRRIARERVTHFVWQSEDMANIPQSPHGFANRPLLEHMQRLNEKWNQGGASRQILLQATASITRLAWSSREIAPEDDTLASNALAMLALTQEATQRKLALEESMLAASTGYHTHSDKLLEQLYAFAPWRLYREKRDHSLKLLASQRQSDQDAIDLWLARLAEDKKQSEWKLWFSRSHQHTAASSYTLSTTEWFSSFGLGHNGKHMLPATIIAEANDNQTAMQLISHTLFQQDGASNYEQLGKAIIQLYLQLQQNHDISSNTLEETLKKNSKNFTGPFFSSEDFVSYYRGLYLASLQKLGLFYLDNWSSMERSRVFNAIIPAEKGSSIGAISQWYDNLVKANDYAANTNAMMQDLASPHLTISMILRTFEELGRTLKYASPQRRKAASAIIARMDSRIGHRYKLISLSREHLLYFSLSEKMAQSILQQEPGNSYGLTRWLGNYYNDEKLLLRVIEAHDAPIYQRSLALSALAKIDNNADDLSPYFISLIKEEPSDWRVRSSFVEHLKSHGQYDKAIATISDWMLAAGEDNSAFDHWEATIALTENYLETGDLELAWETIDTITDSMYGPALITACKVKLAQGDLDAAQAIAVRSANRYPQSTSHITNLLGVLWRQGEYKAAAAISSKLIGRFSPEDIRFKLAREFAEAFKNNVNAASRAISAMERAGLNYATMMYLPQGFYDKENYRYAFDVESRLTTKPNEKIPSYIKAYSYLSGGGNDSEAIAWLKPKISKRMQNYSSMIYFGNKQYPLLWLMINNPGSDVYPDAVWLYRAAAYVDGATITPEQLRELQDYYRSHSSSKYDLMGAYLMGFADESVLLGSPMDNRTISETAFYLGLKAKQENDYDSMSDWFLVSVETSSPINGEYRWSYNRLMSWYTKGKSLPILLAEDGG